MPEPSTRQFQVGGAVRQGAFYVSRAADDELPAALLDGEFCYVLAPRQIGKSSLRVRTKKRLEQAGVRCVTIDLTSIGSRDSSVEQWYFGVVYELSQQLGLDSPESVWQQHSLTSPVHRLSHYLRREVLERVTSPIVIFIDELDAILSQQTVSRDDFFAAVRAYYNARADDRAYERLTFCLIGVALPGDLIADETRTPFNIGCSISLNDFTREELNEFLPGLSSISSDPASLLDSVFSWTSGHPYMTQKVLQALAAGAHAATPITPASVDQRVEQLFLLKGRVLEANLSYAEKYFLADGRAARTLPMLRLYGRILAGEQVSAQGDSPVQVALRLTGMAAERRDEVGVWLRVRNRIFATVFDTTWVHAQESDRRIAEPLHRWLESKRSDDYLLRGQALEEARTWSRSQRPHSEEESAFLLASLDLAHREAEERRRMEQARQAADEERAHWQQQDEHVRVQQRNTLALAAAGEHFAYFLLRFLLPHYLQRYLNYREPAAISLFVTFLTVIRLAPLGGGLIADRFLGYRRSVLIGSALLAIGYCVLVIPNQYTLYMALCFLIAGRGLFEPSMATLVGSIYPCGDVRQERSFLIYHVSLNFGVTLSEILGSAMYHKYGWSIGLAVAGAGMLISLAFYALSYRTVHDSPSNPAPLPPEANGSSSSPGLTIIRIGGPVTLLLTIVLFLVVYTQNNTVFSQWSKECTDLTLGGWLREPLNGSIAGIINPILVLMYSPVLFWLFGRMDQRSPKPSTATKMMLGILLTAASFALMALGGIAGGDARPVSAGWLIGGYSLLALGQLFFVPMGLSLITQLASRRSTATLMSIWFMTLSFGRMLSELTSGLWSHWPHHLFCGLLAGIAFVCFLLLGTQREFLRRLIEWRAHNKSAEIA